MERENRYLVIKIEDITEFLTAAETSELIHLEECIKARKGKPSNNYVVVGEDWPMYEATWKAIENWVDSMSVTPNGKGDRFFSAAPKQ